MKNIFAVPGNSGITLNIFSMDVFQPLWEFVRSDDGIRSEFVMYCIDKVFMKLMFVSCMGF